MTNKSEKQTKEPKFKIGDEVYLFSRTLIGKIVSEKITGVIMDYKGGYRYAVDQYGDVSIDGDSFLDEGEFFATKEELIKSL